MLYLVVNFLLVFLSTFILDFYWWHFCKNSFNAIMNCFIHLIISILYGRYVNAYDVKFKMLSLQYENKNFKFSSKINLDEVKMTYLGLYVTFWEVNHEDLVLGLDSSQDKFHIRALC